MDLNSTTNLPLAIFNRRRWRWVDGVETLAYMVTWKAKCLKGTEIAYNSGGVWQYIDLGPVSIRWPLDVGLPTKWGFHARCRTHSRFTKKSSVAKTNFGGWVCSYRKLYKSRDVIGRWNFGVLSRSQVCFDIEQVLATYLGGGCSNFALDLSLQQLEGIFGVLLTKLPDFLLDF